MSFTLRIYTNGDGEYSDTEHSSLEALYNSIFENYQPDAIVFTDTKPGVNLNSGWAVYDNATGLCINSINAAQVGHSLSEPAYQPFGPQTIGV